MAPQLPEIPTPHAPHGRENAAKVALQISLVYLLVGLIWIFASDRLLLTFVSPENLGRIQTVKGCAFIVITALLLFFLILHFVRSMYSAQTQHQQNLSEAAAQYHMLFQKNPFPMWVYSPETLRILDVNDTAPRQYGYSREEFLAMKITDLRPPDQVQPLLEDIRTITPSPRISGPWVHCRKNGVTLDVEAISDAITFNGKPARLVLALDVTERLRAQRALEQSRAQLEQRVAARTSDLHVANQKLQDEIRERQHAEAMLRSAKQLAEDANNAKSAFLANTSHEIRTPLTSIMGYADLLLDSRTSLTPEGCRHLSVLQQNASHLLKLIDDLSDLSRIEMGRMRWSFENYSPRDIAEQAIEVLRPRAAEKPIELNLDLGPNLPESLYTDGVRLRQVLINLLTNAVKFTSKGSVTLAVQLDAAHPPPSGTPNSSAVDFLRFTVIDTGIGIEHDELQRIFEPFYQVESGHGGTGLGLAISRQIVEHLGGTIRVSSTPGAGSSFSVILPANSTYATTNIPQPFLTDQHLDGQILLAEDNDNIRLLVDEYLRRAGSTVTAVPDGLAAVKAVQDPARHDNPFDLILLDIHMPVMDGEEALRQIRGIGYRGPIVILTAQPNAQTTEARRLQLAGANAIASKPIDRQTFIPLLARLLRDRRPAKTSV